MLDLCLPHDSSVFQYYHQVFLRNSLQSISPFLLVVQQEQRLAKQLRSLVNRKSAPPQKWTSMKVHTLAQRCQEIQEQQEKRLDRVIRNQDALSSVHSQQEQLKTVIQEHKDILGRTTQQQARIQALIQEKARLQQIIHQSSACRQQKEQKLEILQNTFEKGLQLQNLNNLQAQVQELLKDKTKMDQRIGEHKQRLADKERALNLQWEFSKIDLHQAEQELQAEEIRRKQKNKKVRFSEPEDSKKHQPKKQLLNKLKRQSVPKRKKGQKEEQHHLDHVLLDQESD